MYRCAITGKNSREGDKLNRIVVETRSRIYEHKDPETEEKWFSYGTEIVREVNATDAGQELWNTWTAEQKAAFIKR
jgi:hypothetical protein